MIDLNLCMFGGGGGDSGLAAAQNKSIKLGSYITSPSHIQASQSYILYNAKADKTSNVPGEYLLNQIKENKIQYDKDSGMWVSIKGNRYDIRRRRR